MQQEPAADRGEAVNGTAMTSDPLVRAVQFLNESRFRDAFAAADVVCRAAPGRAEAFYARGQASVGLGDSAEAERDFAQAVRLKPGWAGAWVNLGLALYAQGRVQGAIAAMRAALRAAPGHPAATANLGALLRLTGYADTAENLLRDSLSRSPDNVGARLNLVAELLLEERAADALALLDGASPPEDPAPARHWHLQRALALIGLSRIAEARAALAELDALGPLPDALAPLRLWRLAMIALAERRVDDARREAARMEAAIESMGPGAVLEHRIMAHYDLARFWTGLGEHSRAFAHWTAGHKILGTSQPFSREAARAFADAAAETFTSGRYAHGPRASNDDPSPVFIVGMPRSGTTLAERILDAHAEARGVGERAALGQMLYRLGGGETPEAVARIAAMPREALDAAASAYLAELRALAPGKSRIVDKMPANANFVWLIALMFPAAKVIHCVRDPRDIGLSIFTFRFHGEHGYAHDLKNLGWAIADQSRRMAHWKRVLPATILTVNLADWVQDFDATLARALTHLDLGPDPNCARFYASDSRVRTVSRAQVRQPINARGLGRWKTYANELAPLIAELEKGGALGGEPEGVEPRTGFEGEKA